MSITYSLQNNPNLYLNITNQCSNKCYFCLKNFWPGIGQFNLTLDKEPSYEEVIKEIEEVINTKCWREVVFTGFGEPTERLDLVIAVIKYIKSHHHIRTRLDTNGHGSLLNPGRDVVKELKEAGLNRVSVSLNTPNKELYKKVCRPVLEAAFESVLDFIKRSKNVFDTEITAVDLNEVDMHEMEKLAKEISVRFRKREYIQPLY
jgi:TatD family-associated radical SAM protein